MRKVDIEELMTVADVSRVIKRPVRWIRVTLLEPRILSGAKLGGNSWRVRPADLQAWIDKGMPTGHAYDMPSGRFVKGSSQGRCFVRSVAKRKLGGVCDAQ